MTVTDPLHVMAVRYDVSILPENWDDTQPDPRRHWTISVELAAYPDTWAVRHWPYCLSAACTWDIEPFAPRTEEWLAVHRFPLEQALRLARLAAPDVAESGVTARSVLAASGLAPIGER